MAIDVKNFIIQKIKEINPNIDTRAGSVYSDLVIYPLSSLLSSYQTDHDHVIKTQSIVDLTKLTDAELDAVGANFLIERNSGTRGGGNIRLYFTKPRNLVIPAGTQFTGPNGLKFTTSSVYSVTRSQMADNVDDYPNYDSGDIFIQASAAGVEYNIANGSAFTIDSTTSITPNKTVSVEKFSGGTTGEDNETYFARIIDTVFNKSLASASAIESQIKTSFTDVEIVETIGAGHPLMIRDLTSYLDDVSNYISDDFYLVYSGQHGGEYDRKNIAYANNFIDNNESADVFYPAISGWTKELSNDMYEGIYRKNDANYVESAENYIIKELFDDLINPSTGQTELAILLTSGQWQVHDGSNPSQSLYYVEEIGVDSSRLRLGKTQNSTIEDSFTTVSVSALRKVISYTGTGTQATATLAQQIDSIEAVNFVLTNTSEFVVGEFIQIDSEIVEISTIIDATNVTVIRGKDGTNPSTHAVAALIFSFVSGVTQEQIDAIRGIISGLSSPDNVNNTSPIFHRQISQHLGVDVRFTMETTDMTENGEMAYATVLRNSEVFIPHDGYGIALRKQPGFLLRMEAGTQTTDDITKFAEHYGVSELVAASYVGSIKANPVFWKYNVYLVDNDALQEEIWIGHEQLWDQTSGQNQFLQAAKAWIEPNLVYQVRAKIYSNMGFEAWVYDIANPPEEPYANANRLLNRGETYPPYVPQSGDKVETDTGLEILESYRNHFGVAVGETRNYEWYIDNLEVKSFVQTFPMHLFRFKVDAAGFDTSNRVEVNYYGVGYDPVLYAQDGNTGHSSVRMSVWNVTQQQWEDQGEHTYTIDDVRANQLITGILPLLSDYVDGDGYLNMSATATNSGPDFSSDTLHYLRTYYVEMNNIDLPQVHRGNAMDIYVHDPINVLDGSATDTLVGTTIETENIAGIDDNIQEIMEIKEAISGTILDSSLYNITNLSPSKTYSSEANYQISFSDPVLDGALLEFVYRYWGNGDAVTALLDSESSLPISDQLVKVMPPTVVNIEKLEYSGGPGSDDMKEVVVNYFNTLGEQTFDKSDLVQVLYNAGATFVNLSIDIVIREYDTEGTRTTVRMVDQTYDIRADVVSEFYTHIDELEGVAQV
jgi:hypothetical protein